MALNQGRAPKGADAKALGQRREADVNRDRLVFCYANLVGHRVSVKLRDQATYEGLFHSCAPDGDNSITLKCARRLPSQELPSGEVIGTLLIPAKDFLQISAEDVPPFGADEEESSSLANRGFATDGEISKKKVPTGAERELVQWQPDAGDEDVDGSLGKDSGLGKAKDARGWDQFKTNEQMFGVSSTYNEDFYTTKLDPASIPDAKRKEADRIAREIEKSSHEVEHKMDGEDDEEADFSAVTGTGACPRKVRNGSADRSGRSALASVKDLPQVPLTKESLNQHDSMSGADDFHREHRTKRGMITAHSPMRSPMVSEMKRINALNLEPALPKLDDKTRADWINFKQSQTRNQAKTTPQACLKEEFKQSLDLLRKREAVMKKDGDSTEQQNFAASSSTAVAERSGDVTGHRGWNSSAPSPLELGRSSEVSIPKASGSAAAVSNGASIGAVSPSADRKDVKSSTFSFNPSAKEFSFNPQASVFTPTNASAEQPSSFGMQAQQASAPSPKAQSSSSQFTCTPAKSELLSKRLVSLLDPFFELTLREPANAEPRWAEAVGPPSNQVLGQPNPANPMPPVGAMPGGAVPAWQQGQQQQAPGQLPQGVAPSQPQMNAMPSQQGFVVQQVAPGGQPGQQMFQQMYQAPQGNMSAQRPPQGGNMPMQGQPMVFNGQQMYGLQRADGQTSMMPANMVVPQSGPMGAMPKFQGQVMVPMAPTGQFSQGFSPQQGQMQQGQQQQPPPQMGGPQMMQQQQFVPSHQQGGKQGGKRS